MNKDILLLSMFMIVSISVLILLAIIINSLSSIESNSNYLANILDVGTEMDSLGLYHHETENILVETHSRTNKEICLTFLHELGHSIQQHDYYLSFVLGDTNSKEEFAINYAQENSFRCDNI